MFLTPRSALWGCFQKFRQPKKTVNDRCSPKTKTRNAKFCRLIETSHCYEAHNDFCQAQHRNSLNVFKENFSFDAFKSHKHSKEQTLSFKWRSVTAWNRKNSPLKFSWNFRLIELKINFLLDLLGRPPPGRCTESHNVTVTIDKHLNRKPEKRLF